MLDYDETLEIVNLSTGKPKTTDKLISTAYLRVDNNKVSDIVTVQTKDFVDVQLLLSYNVNFLPEYKDKWFSVDNYVKHLCDRERSLLKREAKKHSIEEFYANAADIVRNVALAKSDEKSTHKGRLFTENGMLVTDVEVLSVKVEATVAKMMERHQAEMIQKTLDLSDATRKAEITKKLAEYEREENELSYANKMHAIELNQKVEAEKLANIAEINALKRSEEEAAAQAKADMQVILDTIHEAQLARDRKADDERIATEKSLAAIEEAKQKAYAETVAKIYAAISPDLVAALQAQSNASIMNGIGQAISPVAIAKGESVADAINTLIRGTSLEKTMKNIVEAKAEAETK